MLTLLVTSSLAVGTPRIVVASGFDREFDMAEIKINESMGVADRIIFGESPVSQTGHPRVLRLSRLKRHHPAIEVYSYECNSKEQRDWKLGWGCEGVPREGVRRDACNGEDDSTVVVLSDADEIVSGSTLMRLKQNPPPSGIIISFARTMSVHMYGFFWQKIGESYSTATAFTCKTERNKEKKRPSVVQFPFNSGWHCSYCFPVDEYLGKMHNMLKGDGWLSLSDHYWSLETLYAFRQNGIPLNERKKMSPSVVDPPLYAQTMPYLVHNTNLTLHEHPTHPFVFP